MLKIHTQIFRFLNSENSFWGEEKEKYSSFAHP